MFLEFSKKLPTWYFCNSNTYVYLDTDYSTTAGIIKKWLQY